MARKVAIGIQSFEEIRAYRDTFYIDKTSFIREWWDQRDSVTLITRPRRFGKTLNLSMLECFFSNQYAGRRDLFEGLSVWEDEEYQELQGTYPVIALSFAGVKSETWQGMVKTIRALIVETYDRFAFLADWEGLTRNEREQFLSVNVRIEQDMLARALNALCVYLSRYYGKKVLIFLDEYDTPMQEAYISGFWEETASFFRNLFNNTFKTNPAMMRSVLTGVTRISRESVFSDLNNLKVITTTSRQYATSFGFTEKEVFDALDEQGMSEQREAVKRWYDGFIFGGVSDIYNPWSMINFLRDGELRSYWANTSANGLVSALIRQGDKSVKQTMEDLLEGKSFVAEIDEQIVFDRLDTDRNAMWSLLLASGYLKAVKSRQRPTGHWECEMELTDLEVKVMFEDMVRGWFAGDDSYNEFVKALLADDLEAMNGYINEVALEVFSSFDPGKHPSEKKAPERFYHGFVLGLIVELRGRYRITSNRESGFGRYDVMLEPLQPDLDAMVLEFKVFNSRREDTLEDTVAAALAQIEEKRYDTELSARGVARERIRHYGSAFRGKEVLIGQQ